MIFSSDVVIGRVGLHLAAEPLLNRPRIDAGGSTPEFLTPERLGFPLMQRRSRMSDARRFFPDPAACAQLEVSADGQAESKMMPFAGTIRGWWESPHDQERAIEQELAASRETLESKIAAPVQHICLPWGVSGTLAHTALRKTGYITAFANRMSGRFAVAANDHPYFLKRLSGRHIFALPGRGRRPLTLLA
jgi:hypothetical protein